MKPATNSDNLKIPFVCLCSQGQGPQPLDAPATAAAPASRARRSTAVRRTPGRRFRGATIVEMAAVTPVFVLLVLALFEFGRMTMVQQVVTNSAREGARQAILYHLTHDEAVAIVRKFLDEGSLPTAAVSITPNLPPNKIGFGDPITVAVSVPFRDVSWIPIPQFLGNPTLSSTSVMQAERPE